MNRSNPGKPKQKPKEGLSIKAKLARPVAMAVWILLIASAVFARTGKTFTLDELAKYNGKNGVKAYVAVNGTVYDVTGLPQWPQGKHFCPGSVAGTDITELYQRSPHMKRSDYLARFPVVGRLVASTQPTPSPNPLVSGSPLPTTNPQSTPAPRRSLVQNPIGLGLLTIVVILGIWLWYRLKQK